MAQEIAKGEDSSFHKHTDGKIMLLAGLWDSVQYEGTSQLYELMIGTDEQISTYYYECREKCVFPS
jgi:putative SOS response-associated peptidase YedK